MKKQGTGAETEKEKGIEIEKEKEKGIIQEVEALGIIEKHLEKILQKTWVSWLFKIIGGTCVYITNLSRNVKEYQLEDLFKKYGAIKDVIVVRDPFTKESRGFAFLTYETSESARHSISEMSGYELNDRRIVCEIAKRNKSRVSTPGVYLGPSSAKRMRSRYERVRYKSRSRSSDRRKYRKYDYRSRSRGTKDRDRSRSFSRRRWIILVQIKS